MAMTGMRAFTVDLGIVEQTPPEAIFKQRARCLLRRVPKSRRRAAIELVHWGYGAAGGAAFAALPESLRRRAMGRADLRFRRPGSGSRSAWRRRWASRRPPSRDPLERLALAGDHLLYGFVLSETRRRPQR